MGFLCGFKDMMADKPVNMGPFGNDEEVKKLVKYGIEHDRQRLMEAGILPKKPAPAEKTPPAGK